MRLGRKSEGTPYERWGGAPFFETLVARFYEGVEVDPLLRPMYPDDLTESRAHLALFLGQYWGGPPDYNAQRGAPRLRMRHAPFVIGRPEADAWTRHMRAAVDAAVAEGTLEPDDASMLFEYLELAARTLVNR